MTNAICMGTVGVLAHERTHAKFSETSPFILPVPLNTPKMAAVCAQRTYTRPSTVK